jgi:predicted GNAT family acetyltransferase
MGWCTTSDLDEFLKAADAHLRARPVDNTLLLSAAEDFRADGCVASDPLFGWLEQGGGIRGAFVHVPPRPVLVGGLAPEASAVLADTLARLPRKVCGVDATAPAAEAFATTWRQRTGEAARVHRQTRVYRLTGPVPDLPSPPGNFRVATREDGDVVAAWLAAFDREVGVDLSGMSDAGVEDLLVRDRVRLWVTPDDVPVAMAIVTSPVAGAVRLSLVYTPPPLRHHGYGAATLVEASRAARQDGAAEVLLITDVSSPLTGGVRKRLGCVPCGDRLLLSFDPAVPAPRSPTLQSNGRQ